MTAIRRLLIANRGEIARRVIGTAQRMGVATVAVYSDADANALHVREATHSVALHGDASADTYLRIDKLIAAAKSTGADAVHPGYGFLSENADFAQAVIDAGLTWVGPPPEAIRALGNKSRAKVVAQQQGVPCLPGYHGDDQSDECIASEAARIGFPVMVKAAAGGGGRGMRLVASAGELHAALQSARSEALSAFGCGELLLERALLAPRHVEVQVFADTHGNCIALGERDCSVQRRHQKIIEESPCPAIDASMREAMCDCAVRLAKAAGYVGAGTVEFLVARRPHPHLHPRKIASDFPGDPEDPPPAGEGEISFFLMEMNTRLQVEHAVTEAVTGLDLVEWQLRVAQGEPLPQREVTFTGHAIEVRLCAEDDAFQPQAGAVHVFLPPPLGEGRGGGTVRLDHCLLPGIEVPPHYDSLLAKLIAHAPTRDEAIDRLASALDALQILGIPTNRRFLAACLRHPEFMAGKALIPFIESNGAAIRKQLHGEEAALVRDAAVAALAPSTPALAAPFTRPLRARHRDALVDVPVLPGDAGRPDATVVPVARGRHHVQIGPVDFFIDDASYDPPASAAGSASADELRAPFNGKVIAVRVQPGSAVAKGDALIVLESMKLEHALAATRDGVVRAIHVTPGEQAATSQVLLTLEPAQPAG